MASKGRKGERKEGGGQNVGGTPAISSPLNDAEDAGGGGGVTGDATVPPPLRPTDSWEDSDGEDDCGGSSAETDAVAVPRAYFEPFLERFTAWSANSLRTDQVLKLLQWSFWALSRMARPGPSRPGHRSIISDPELSPALRKIYADLSLVRYALRLFGLPPSILAARTGSWGAGWDDARIENLGKFMGWSMALYHPFEHVAFATWVVPKLLKDKVDAGRMSAISCRFWLAYIGADLVSSVFKIRELGKRREKVVRQAQTTTLTNNETEARRADLDKQVKLQRIHLARCALFALPAVNWSLPRWDTDPWLPEGLVNTLMLGESITCIYQALITDGVCS